MNCLNCRWLVLVWGGYICEAKEIIVDYPQYCGRFCKLWEEKDEETQQNIPQKKRCNK